jgi:MFS family permease
MRPGSSSNLGGRSDSVRGLDQLLDLGLWLSARACGNRRSGAGRRQHLRLPLPNQNTGMGIGGCQAGLNSLSGRIYPPAIRSTGAGWALGLGRVGTIGGPLLGGVLNLPHCVPSVAAAEIRLQCPCVVTAWPAGLGGLGALAVDDCPPWGWRRARPVRDLPSRARDFGAEWACRLGAARPAHRAGWRPSTAPFRRGLSCVPSRGPKSVVDGCSSC